MKFVIKLVLLLMFIVMALVCYLGAVSTFVGTIYIALTDPQFDRYARQVAVIVVFIIIGSISASLADRIITR